MTRPQIIALQQRIGATPDGFWGPRSVHAAQLHLRTLMPSPNPWPRADERSLVKFYGPHGDESRIVSVKPPFVTLLYGEPGHFVKGIRIHERCAESLLRVLHDAEDRHGDDLTLFGPLQACFGGYVDRPMRGGKLPSLHAYGAAVDYAAHTNGNATHWPTKATMPIEIMECFARQCWLAAGAFWSRDAMHFQATQ